MTPERIDHHLDAILKASGSALRHYSMQKTLDDMRAAMRAAMDDAVHDVFDGIVDAVSDGETVPASIVGGGAP